MQTSFSRARMLSDGSIVYPKKGFEPPPPIEGYERDPGDPWHFKPIWPDCKARIQTLYLKKCGATGILSVCANQECPKFQKQLTLTDCQGCPFRQGSEGSESQTP